MEKTIHIIIASTTFVCTEEAYEKLSLYLKGMRTHFSEEAEHEEIMKDIESRIAEKLLEKKTSVISISEVTSIISEMGDVSELEDANEATTPLQPERRLYRDLDTALIGGVASGLAAYFNTDTLLIRTLFVISIFFGGTGIVAYIILWIFIPEAKTSAQKLEMRGTPVTFDAISDFVRTRTEDIERVGTLQKIPLFIQRVLSKLFSFAGKATGIVLALGSFFSIIGLTTFLGVVLTNWNAPYNDLPLKEASSDLLLLTAAGAGYLTALIPLLFIFALGYRLINRKVLIPSILGFGLLGIWSLAVVVTGVSGFKIAGDYYSYTQTSPEYAVLTRTVPLPSYSRIVAERVSVQVANGDTSEATLEGRNNMLDRVSLEVQDDTLFVRMKEGDESCFFCDEVSPTITLFAPTLSSIEIDRGGIVFDTYATSSLALVIVDGRAYGTLDAQEVSIDAKNASIDTALDVETLSLKSSDSYLVLSGTASTTDMSLINSTTLQAKSLVIQNAILEATDSVAELTVRGTLEDTVDEESEIIVNGKTVYELEDPESD